MANRLREFRRSRDRTTQPIGGSKFREVAEQLVDETSHLSQIWDAEHQRYVTERLVSLVSKDFNEKTIAAFRESFLKERAVDEVAKELGTTMNAVVIARCRVLKKLRESGGILLD